MDFLKKTLEELWLIYYFFFNFSISSFDNENKAVSDPEKKAEIVKDNNITKIDNHSDNQKSNTKSPKLNLN